MTDPRIALRERFQQTNASARRRRLNLRLPAEYLAKLRRIRLATGIDQNTLCCDALLPAIDKAHDDLQKSYDDAAWSIIVRCAERHG